MIAAIAEALRRDGPLPLARAMAMAADHYYRTREPFGTHGDFVTAPEISQMFGELIGLALADLWQRAGAPAPVLLVELGPGRGTLMADAWRAIARAAPPLAAAAAVHLVERSPRLAALQRTALPHAIHHESLDTLPGGPPILLVANEFLDALPLTQFVAVADGWLMRHVGPSGFLPGPGANLAFLPPAILDSPPGTIFERNFAAEGVAASLARRLARAGGAALLLDYGHIGPATGDTLQAIRAGAFADPVATLGEADLSAHVDFAAIAAAARRAAPAAVHGPVPQGAFLEAIGLSARAEALKRGRSAEARAEIAAAHARLTAPAAMGRLFQALALTAPGWPSPAGFPSSAP